MLIRLAPERRRPEPEGRSRARGGTHLALAGIVVGALMLLGLPSMAVADDGAPTGSSKAAEAQAEAGPAGANGHDEAAGDDQAAVPAEPPAEDAVPVEDSAPADSAPPAEELLDEQPAPDARSDPAEVSTFAAVDAVGGPPVTIPEWGDHVDICHSTESEGNPFVFISPSVRSIIDPNGDPGDPFSDGHAHSVHHDFSDIIPAFDYFDADGRPGHFDGLNLDLLPWLDNECMEPEPVPSWLLMKSSDPVDGSTVEPGDLVTYTLTAFNDSEAVVTGAQAFDDVSDVLDNATLQSIGAGLSGPVGGVLTWDVPELDPGESAMVSYTVQVNADAFSEVLHNVVTPSEGGECPVLDEPSDLTAVAVPDDANGPCVVDHPVVDEPPVTPPVTPPANVVPAKQVLAETGVSSLGLVPLGAAFLLLGAVGLGLGALRRRRVVE